MQEVSTYRFFIVNRDRNTKLRYNGLFVPRVSDTIVIGEYALKVVDVVVESAQASGEGVQHALYVHVQETEMPLDGEECEDLELNEFCARMKDK